MTTYPPRRLNRPGVPLRVASAMLLAGFQLAAQPAAPPDTLALPKISAELLQSTDRSEPVAVFIELRNQPHAAIRQRVEATFGGRLRAAEATLAALPAGSLHDDGSPYARAAREWEDAVAEARALELRELDAAIRPEQDVLVSRLVAAGATAIRRYRAINMVKADVPGTALLDLAQDEEVGRISAVGFYQSSAAKDSVTALGAPALWAAQPTQFKGKLAPSLVVLDSGIDYTHEALDDKNVPVPGLEFSKVFLETARTSICWGDQLTAGDLHGHGTAVADIAAGAGDQKGDKQGVAPDLAEKSVGSVARIYNLKVAFKQDNGRGVHDNCDEKVAGLFDDDLWKAIDYVIGLPGDLVVNFSFAIFKRDAPWSDYTEEARRFDRLVDNNSPRVTVVVATGNNEKLAPWLGSPLDALQSPAMAYNVITVGASVDHPADTIDTRSAKGPTKDGRRKPDVAAPGETWVADRKEKKSGKYDKKWGTSFAAAHVSGAVALIAEAVGTGNNMALKALLLNEARRPGANPGAQTTWMKTRGWGFASLSDFPDRLKEATGGRPICEDGNAGYRTFCFTDSVSADVGDRVRFYQGQSRREFFATLAWNRHFPNRTVGAQPLPLNDLNLSVYSRTGPDRYTFGNTGQPSSGIDNVEQIYSRPPGDLVLKVKLDGDLNKPDPDANDAGDFRERYALATTHGFTPKAPPLLRVTCAAPPAAPDADTEVTVNCTVTNDGELPVADLTVAPNPAGTVGGVPELLAAGASAPFTVKVKGAPITVSLKAAAVFAEEPYDATGSFTVARGGGGACTFSTPLPIPITAAGQTGTVNLPVGAGCAWTVNVVPFVGAGRVFAGWLTMAPMSGTGPTTLTYTAVLGPAVTGPGPGLVNIIGTSGLIGSFVFAVGP